MANLLGKKCKCGIFVHANASRGKSGLAVGMQMTVAAVKEKLSSHCGTSAQDMARALKNARGQPVVSMGEDGRMLGYYSPCDG